MRRTKKNVQKHFRNLWTLSVISQIIRFTYQLFSRHQFSRQRMFTVFSRKKCLIFWQLTDYYIRKNVPWFLSNIYLNRIFEERNLLIFKHIYWFSALSNIFKKSLPILFVCLSDDRAQTIVNIFDFSVIHVIQLYRR